MPYCMTGHRSKFWSPSTLLSSLEPLATARACFVPLRSRALTAELLLATRSRFLYFDGKPMDPHRGKGSGGQGVRCPPYSSMYLLSHRRFSSDSSRLARRQLHISWTEPKTAAIEVRKSRNTAFVKWFFIVFCPLRALIVRWCTFS